MISALAARTRMTEGQLYTSVITLVVGVLLALPLAGVLLGAERLTQGPPLLACALVVALHAVATRGLHLDGLADLADGLGSYGTPERARAVMKAPDVGALGAAFAYSGASISAPASAAASRNAANATLVPA